ncbi:IS110 family transposase, partial [Enterococcus faecium]|nr:IS110 family transposase [Enterococcus faecium]MCH3316911.1 IS110 family transposase [Enterococcus faecium]
MKLFVGLDVSSEKLDACFMTDDSTCSVLKEASYGNSQLGASQIKEYILEFSQKFEIESLVIGMEATSLYSFGMATVFLTNFIRCRTSFRMLFRLSLTMSLLGCDDLRQELTVKVRLP